MSPDRIEVAAGDVKSAAHQLVDEVKKERRSRRLGFTLTGIALFGLAVCVVVIVTLVVSNRRLIDRVERERNEQKQQDASELQQRLCNAWENRIEDHATLTEYLAEFVGDSERGQLFVTGLRDEYAASDARYARERDLTVEACA